MAAVRANKGTFGIPTTEAAAIGIYRNPGGYGYPNCDPYGHSDHTAVHSALWNFDMLAAPQYGRTCGSDPDRDTTLTRSMSSGTTHSTWFTSPSTRTGLFHDYYGWLYHDVIASNHHVGGATTTTASPPWCGRAAQPDPISTTPENEAQIDQTYECGAIFTTVQHYWRRFS